MKKREPCIESLVICCNPAASKADGADQRSLWASAAELKTVTESIKNTA